MASGDCMWYPVVFTPDETQWLRQGVSLFGFGNWCQILASFPFRPELKWWHLEDRALYLRMHSSRARHRPCRRS